MTDHDERADLIAAAAHNYTIGEWTRVRCEPVLRACGMNATEVNDFFAEHRDAAEASMKERAKLERPVR